VRRIVVLLSAVALAVGYFVLSALPASGESSGQVTASVQVEVAAPCITLETTSTSFGTLDFSSPGRDIGGPGVPEIGYSNCSPRDERIYVRGSDANGPSGRWALVPLSESLCSGSDRFHLVFGLPLTASDQVLADMPAGGSRSSAAAIQMPCKGSSGAGELMTMSIILTAAF
jgi:hypothetical protein